jgi:mono/diheme cytochrome c family protein
MTCHNAAAGNTLGLETRQLATNIVYPKTGRQGHQLVTLNTIGAINPQIANADTQTPYPDPFDPSAPLADRARAYLHTNCSLCHRPSGPTDADMDLRFGTALNATAACNVPPKLGDLGIANAQLIAPGDPEHSVLLQRMSVRDGKTQMPPVGSLKVDDQGVALIREWIASLSTCN